MLHCESECGVNPVFALKDELGITEDDQLAIMLMYEKLVKVHSTCLCAHRGSASRCVPGFQRESSAWYPHIRRLPARLHNAFYFDEADFALLKG